ncbi:MAG: hypothetical protein NT105_24115 [Verrucomicrobia bacterium]|nr:hypothetical protein [Verrucomicrobiota bacterium]
MLAAGLPAVGADKVVIQNSRLEVALDPAGASFTVCSKTTGKKELRLIITDASDGNASDYADLVNADFVIGRK